MSPFLVALLLVLSPTVFAEGQQPLLDKWWPMCVFDGSGAADNNPHVKEMVRMAAMCGVHLDIYPAHIPPGADGGNPKAFMAAAKQKCNLTYGFRALGANRGSILAILGNEGTARRMCSAQGAIDRKSCGELSFDPGESIKFKMANAGYFGGVAEPGQPAVSIVAGNSINARDMSAVALGQGMMALPQGFGSGNGVGSEYEGQLAGGVNVDSGWSDYGCRQMRAAAFDNPKRNMYYRPDINDWFPTKGKLFYLDVYDTARPLFGKPGGTTGGMVPSTTAVRQSGAPVTSAKSVGGATSREMVPPSESVFRSSSSSSRASQSSAAPTGHPNRTQGQVTSLRQSEEPPVQVETTNPTSTPERKGSKVSMNDDAKIDAEYLKELGASASANSYSGGESSLQKIAAQAEAAASAAAASTASGSSAGTPAGSLGVSATGAASSTAPNAGTAAATSGISGTASGGVTNPTTGSTSSSSATLAGGTAAPDSAAKSNFTKAGDFWAGNRGPASSVEGEMRRSEASEDDERPEKEEERSGRRSRTYDYYGNVRESGTRAGGSDTNVTRIGR